MQENDAFRIIPAEIADKLILYIAIVGLAWAYILEPLTRLAK